MYIFCKCAHRSKKKRFHSSCSTNKGEAEKCSCRAAFPHGFSRGIKSITPFLGRTKHSRPVRGPQAWQPFPSFSFPEFSDPTLPFSPNDKHHSLVSVYCIIYAVKSRHRKILYLIVKYFGK